MDDPLKKKIGFGILGTVGAALLFATFAPLMGSSVVTTQNHYITWYYNGNCYLFTGASYDAMNLLDKEWQLKAMKLHLQAIEDPNTEVRINFFGSRASVQDFIDRYSIKVLSEKDVPPEIDGRDVFGLITKSKLETIVNSLNATDLIGPILNSVEASVSISDPAPSGITLEEKQQIISQLESFRNDGVKQIIDNKPGTIRCP